jgi:hypothetical protein
MTQAHETMRRIGLELIEERSRAVIEEQRQVLSGKSGEIDGDKTILGRDILSVLSESPKCPPIHISSHLQYVRILRLQ